ncbi:MAG TPA: protein kinase [Thermoanaerobaculia bacterium]|nr:protein kinase [Thermoanaerobaculia bacterium]
MDLQAGDKVGRYEIVSFVGAGGMGQVYRARDAQLARDVAIKLLPPGPGSNAQQVVARFQQEARALGLLNHPNLVTVYDFGTHGQSFYIVLELLEGETLREHLRNGGTMTQRKAIHVAAQIAAGMAAAHDRGIIHRDLKPENIFLTRSGGVKILDFGLAKMNPASDLFNLDDDSPTLIGTTPTRPGMVMGTVGYIAPEQLRGEEVDARADIFAFGGILYEMLAGRRAFAASSAMETLSAVLRDDPAGLRQLGVLVMPGLDLVIHRCLEKRPQDRFQSARDLAFALEALGSSTESLTLPFLAGFRKRTRRYRRWIAVAAIVVAAAAGGALLWSRFEPDDPPAYRQLTFRRGDISAARFTPDGGIVYSAAWEGMPYELYTARVDSVEARDLGVPSRELLDVSRGGDLAILVKAKDVGGTLAVAPLAGGAPRELATDVVAAGWSPDGAKLAIARRLPDGRYQVEYPPGQTIYQCATRIRDLAVSPDGRKIAFRLREARLGKDYALVVIDDSGGSARKIGDWTNAKGLAWSPGGNIVFASNSSGSTEIHSATPGGRVHLAGRFDGNVKLHDISPRGDLLLSRDDYREGIMARAPGTEHERDLSWFDGSGASDISPDGHLLLMSEFGEAGGSRYSAYVRPLNGDPAVRLGDGYGVSLSPDGTAALVIVPGTPARLTIVPLGAGQTRVLGSGGINDYEFASWLPDGQAIVFNGRTPKSPMRLYRQTIRGGPPAPFGPPDLRLAQPSRPTSPDGKRLAVVNDDGRIAIMNADGSGAPRLVPMQDIRLRPVAWASNGELYAYRESVLPAKLYRVNVDSGARQLVRDLMPADAAGVYRVMDVVITADDRAYAYGVWRNLSTLFLSTGWEKRID